MLFNNRVCDKDKLNRIRIKKTNFRQYVGQARMP